MKMMICMMGLLALTSCGHFGGCKNKSEQCAMKKAACAKCGSENCTKCPKDPTQCPMEKAATPAPAEAAKK